MKGVKLFLVVVASLFLIRPALAGEIRVHVAEFKLVNADPGSDELKVALQELLASRLSGEGMVTVDSAAEADYQVAGRYTLAGSVFSIDVVARNAAGKIAARAYEQGKSRDELIPALGKLAQRVQALLVKDRASAAIPAPGPASAAEIPRGIVALPREKPVVVLAQTTETKASSWLSQRLVGTFVGLAPGRTVEGGARELFLVGDRTLQLYRQGKTLELICEVSLSHDEQILGVDTADLDGDGIPEVYLTVYNGDALVSQVWTVKDSALKRLAEKLPYYFRGLALDGKERKIYAQKMSMREDFQGDVFELAKSGDGFAPGARIKVPQHGYIYNFTRFADPQGTPYFLELSEGGHLGVVTPKGEELWKSKDSYGAGELFFKRDYVSDVRFNGEPYRKIFIKQRMEVTPDGEIIVTRNSGSWKLGGGTSCLYGLAWNGSTLEKRWHTTESESYLADYYYDGSRQELVRLEVVKPAGMLDQGASVVSVQKVK